NQVFQRGRWREIFVSKIGLIIIQTDIAVIHRQGAVGRVKFQRVRNVGQGGRVVRFKNAFGQGPAKEGIVDAVKHVGQRITFGEDGFVERCPSVARFEKL